MQNTNHTMKKYLFGFFLIGMFIVIAALLLVFRTEDKGSLAWWSILGLMIALSAILFVSWVYERQQRLRMKKEKGPEPRSIPL